MQKVTQNIPLHLICNMVPSKAPNATIIWRGYFFNPNWKELRKLSSKVREAYFYCWDKADACGVYEFDPVYFKADLGFILSPADLQLIPNIKKIASDKYLFTDYISINYGVLKEGYNPHKPAFRDLLKNNITLEFINFQARTKLEEEDKDEEEGEDVKGVVGENRLASEIEFEKFWDLYDKKTDKPKALLKWKNTTPEERILIFEYLPKYKESQPDKQFRKNPATFLHNRSWENEIVKSSNNATTQQEGFEFRPFKEL